MFSPFFVSPSTRRRALRARCECTQQTEPRFLLLNRRNGTHMNTNANTTTLLARCECGDSSPDSGRESIRTMVTLLSWLVMMVYVFSRYRSRSFPLGLLTQDAVEQCNIGVLQMCDHPVSSYKSFLAQDFFEIFFVICSSPAFSSRVSLFLVF